MSPRPRLDHVRRPELLAAATAVIRQRGVENARVADIADEAGTSAASVLYYFTSKAELLEEALTSAEERFYDDLALELEDIESARARLLQIVQSGAGEGDYDAALWMELWARALRDPELAATRASSTGAGGTRSPRSSATAASAASSAPPTRRSSRCCWPRSWTGWRCR